MPTLLNINSEEDFNRLLNDSDSGKLVVVHFWAEWAPQCEQMNDVITELSKNTEYSSVVFSKNGKVVERLEGANVPEFIKAVKAHASKIVLPVSKSSSAKETLNSRLKNLVNAAPCMLFMKGNPDAPKCGFSKQVIALLNEHNADYSTFDILQDETVRQGLKEYSNWPTYPQLYVKGELIGGLDILKEYAENGELGMILPKKEDIKDKLEKLIKKDKVMIFMKGNPQVPKCGFSRTLMGILNETNIPFSTFDILEDEEVRQELKTFSNWPTYPQIYVNGTFVGGLDIIKELKEAGELESTLKGK